MCEWLSPWACWWLTITWTYFSLNNVQNSPCRRDTEGVSREPYSSAISSRITALKKFQFFWTVCQFRYLDTSILRSAIGNKNCFRGCDLIFFTIDAGQPWKVPFCCSKISLIISILVMLFSNLFSCSFRICSWHSNIFHRSHVAAWSSCSLAGGLTRRSNNVSGFNWISKRREKIYEYSMWKERGINEKMHS